MKINLQILNHKKQNKIKQNKKHTKINHYIRYIKGIQTKIYEGQKSKHERRNTKDEGRRTKDEGQPPNNYNIIYLQKTYIFII